MRRRIHIDHRDGTPPVPTEPEVEGEATGTNAPPPAEENAARDEPREPSSSVELDSLQARVADLEQHVEHEHNLYLRTLADFQNFRRRQEEERRQDRQFSNQELVLGLLPILDNFERALAAAEKSRSFEALMGGVALIQRQLQDFLAKNGVEPIEAVGQEFDPNMHEAVMRVEDSEHPENTVVDELQRGYRMHTRVLRPSMVRVAKSE